MSTGSCAASGWPASNPLTLSGAEKRRLSVATVLAKMIAALLLSVTLLLSVDVHFIVQ